MFNQKLNLGLKRRTKNLPMSLERMKTSAKASVYASVKTTIGTSQMYAPFQEKIMDRRSMQVFKTNEANVDPDTCNQFSRNEAWN